MPRPKKYKIILSDKECQELKNIVRNKKTSRTVKCRCQIILDLDEAHGKVPTYEQCAKIYVRLSCSILRYRICKPQSAML